MRPRVACVDLPELPLQIALRERPQWRRDPVAVVAEDRPEAPLVHLNDRARRLRLRLGLRQSAARGVVPALRTVAVPDDRVRGVVEDLTRGLQSFSPRVQPVVDAPGTFLVDPNGLSRLYGGARSWATSVHGYLAGRGFQSAVVVGFHPDRAVAVARTRVGPRILPDPAKERALAEAVPLDRLPMSAALREGLAMLAIETVGALTELPAGELSARFGAEALAIHARFSDGPQLPIQPRALDRPIRVTVEIDPPDADHARLLFAIKGGLHDLVRQTRGRLEALAGLDLTLTLERGGRHRERVEPATPTRDAMTVIELVRLRLAQVTLDGPVCEVRLEARTASAEPRQSALAATGPTRDHAAADRALARIRAAYGPDAVRRARMREAHLPEARFAWEPVRGVARRAAPREGGPTLVRRVLRRPRPLPARVAEDPEAGPTLDPSDEPILRLYGPYRVSGGWWVRAVERDYYYAETAAGTLLWVYFDRPRRRWFLHGLVD